MTIKVYYGDNRKKTGVLSIDDLLHKTQPLCDNTVPANGRTIVISSH